MPRYATHDAAEDVCGCFRAPADEYTATAADTMQARAIAAGFAEFGITPAHWSAAYDAEAAAVLLRVDTPRGLFALAIPALGQPFPVYHRRQRIGALDCRRTYGTTDSYVAALFAAYLRDRGALDFPGKDRCLTA
ncbi:hypothetical protein [Streptacidiphilus sp. MAP5-3]|uniref:hypothetical protein n=1 Tax=unclassified Streptacidiphilus TaxID=2643834 RepID=UPI0035197EE8